MEPRFEHIDISKIHDIKEEISIVHMETIRELNKFIFYVIVFSTLFILISDNLNYLNNKLFLNLLVVVVSVLALVGVFVEIVITSAWISFFQSR